MYPTLSQIEGLFEDINFSTKVSRDTLEEICADLFERVRKPVQDVLRSTEITMVRPRPLYIGTHWHMWLCYTHIMYPPWWHLQASDSLLVEVEVATYHSGIVTHTVPHSIHHTHSMTVNAVVGTAMDVWNI